jgi:RND family efflux transporter MFP subunit
MRPGADTRRQRLVLIGSLVAAASLPFLVSIASQQRARSQEPEPVVWSDVRGGPTPDPAPQAPLADPSRPEETIASLAHSPSTPPAPTLMRENGGDEAGVPSLDCLVEPHTVVQLGSAVEGRIQRITVDKSAYVEVGQVLVELESGVESATVDLAKARAEMVAEERSREILLEHGKRRQQRMSILLEKKAIPLELEDKTDTEARVAAYELQEARERRLVASLELQQAAEILKRRTIVSPINGYVIDRKMSPGEVVDEQTILTIAEIDPLKVEVVAPSALYGQVSVGQKAEVSPEFPPGSHFEATVDVVDRVVDAASGTFGVRLALPNPKHEIPGGLRCRIRFLPAPASAAP